MPDKPCAMLAKGLAYQTLESVTPCGKADLFLRDCEAQAGRMIVALNRQHGEIGIGRALRPCENTFVVGCG